MKQTKTIFKFIFIMTTLLFTTTIFADTYPTKITISKITNNTSYSYPAFELLPHSSTVNPMDFDFPKDEAGGIGASSVILIDDAPAEGKFEFQVNNYVKPYVKARIEGLDNEIDAIVTEENETTYSIVLQQK